MNSKGKAFLEKFRVRESSNMIGLKTFGARGFSIMAGWPDTPTISQKMTESPPRAPSTKFLHPPHKNFTPSYCSLKWDIKV